MKYLLDTNAVSELKRPQPNPDVVGRIQALSQDDCFISVLTVGEITRGVEKLPVSQRKLDLAAWLSALTTGFGDRILNIDADVAQAWGRCCARSESNGISLPAVDGLIAATAICHGLTVVTRDVLPFQAAGSLTLNPWD